MQQATIKVSNTLTHDDEAQIISHLKALIGVIEINVNETSIDISFETPANLNTLEKEVYDLGYNIIS